MDLSGHQGEMSIPMTTTYIPPHSSHTHGHTNNGLTMPRSTLAAEDPNSPRRDATPPATQAIVTKKPMSMVKYKECLKNHAASIGGNATDGCGEFMPSGTDGTIEALKCSACGCHRNFHRKEVEGDPFGSSCHCKGTPYLYSPAGRNSLTVRPSLPALTHHAHHQMVMPLSAMQTSESDEMECVGGTMMGSTPPMMTSHHQSGQIITGKKRFRTKFTPEQKEKMLGFAERVGWRLQRLEDGVVQQFCQEIGVKRRVLKVWMHNNKHSLATKKLGGPDEEVQELHAHAQLQID